MSSLLRSTKFVRYFCGAARTLILNSARNVETNLLINSKSLSAANNVIVRDYATTKKAENLEPLLQNMDTEIRRNGRISKRSIEELFDGIKTKNAISSSQSLLVIRCCGDILSEEIPQKRTQLVQQIWAVLTNIGVPMDISHYNTLLRVYIENEHAFSPAEFLEELQKKGLQPNHVTYQRLMWRYCQQGDIDGATKVLENMRELGLPITVPVLNALVMGHSNLGDTEGAKAVLATVSGTGLQPSNHTYALLACGYARKGDIEGVQSVLKTVNEADIIMTNKDIFSIIEAFAANGHSDKVSMMMEHLNYGPNYGPDAYNAILHLINKGQENVAKTILKTFRRTDESDRDTHFYEGAFFIKQLLKVKQSPQDIVDLCRELKEEGLIPNGILVALEAALQQGNANLAQYLISELRQNGVEIRQHYYWPLLIQKGKEGDEEAVLQIVRNISTDGYTPSKETLSNYVLPYLKDDPQNLVAKLQLANVPTILAARTVVAELLQSNKMREAAAICRTFDLRGNTFIKEPIIGALVVTKDIESFTTILQVVNRDFDASQTENAQSVDIVTNERDAVDLDNIVRRAFNALRRPDLCEKLLSNLLDKGIGINSEAATFIQNFFGPYLTTQISDTLAKLTSPDLAVTPLPKLDQVRRSTVQLELLVKHHQEKGNEVLGLKTQLLQSYIKDGDLVKTEQLINELKNEKYSFNANTLAQIVELYCEHNDLTNALQYRDLLATTYPEFKLNNNKVVTLACAFAKADKIDKVLELLRSHESDDSSSFMLNNKCWQLLNHLAEQKEPEKLKQVFNALLEYKFAVPSNILLGPLIKVHLLREDMDSALAEFEYCCKQYRSSPWKGELMKQLIVTENPAKLQWLADLATEIHGEVNVLYDLVLAFVECGRLRQARRILETPGLHMRTQRIDAACKRYVNVGMIDCLEGLLEATKELGNVDRATIFNHLLSSYIKSDETDKALGLWSRIQEESEVPTDTFLTTLGEYLRSKKIKVPFAMPVRERNSKATPAEKSPDTVTMQLDQQIGTLIQNNKSNEALDLALKSLKSGSKPGKFVISNLLKGFVEKGDVDKILLFKPYYEHERKPINYFHKLSLATIISGSGAQLINDLHQELKKATQVEDIDALLPRFPRADGLNMLLKDSELSIKCEEIASDFVAKGRHLPANLIWMEYLINGNEQKADNIWNKCLCNSTFIKFKRLTQFACDNKQPHLLEKLVGYLNSNSSITPEARGNVYSRLINYHLTNDNNTKKANELVKRLISEGLQLSHINDATWKKFKKVCEENGESFAFELK